MAMEKGGTRAYTPPPKKGGGVRKTLKKLKMSCYPHNQRHQPSLDTSTQNNAGQQSRISKTQTFLTSVVQLTMKSEEQRK